ncbi:MAG: imidazole glycerol phosphate synthase subunit HisH [Kangiella sp.]|nr:imidazole glycerol phosphate synthase subunit HisH [Kangiella sp.]
MSDSVMKEASKTVGVINTGAGNLYSLNGCLRRMGFYPVTINQPSDLERYDISALVIPGQGRFRTVMTNLKACALDEVITNWYRDNKKMVGICIGLQIMFEESEEDPGVSGLGLLQGKVTRLQSPKQPMVGWSDVQSSEDWLNNQTLYFVNSYGVSASDKSIATVTYGQTFVAAIASNNTIAFQCHPEKSGVAGEEVLKQCLS